MSRIGRREFIARAAVAGAAIAAGPLSVGSVLAGDDEPGSRMRLGLVTYQWGAKWDLPTVIKNLEASGVLGVELRTTHAHGVERSLTAQQRREVKQRFADSPAVLVGLGSAEDFDNPDPAKLKQSIEATKAFVRLSHDVGSTGVKVRPNRFHKGVAREKTIEQIGKSLNEVGRFAGEHGQQIRLEVHGHCSPPPIMRQIMDVADDPNVFICWNSNAADLRGKGLKYNFNLLADRLGPTCHIRTLDHKSYPHKELVELLVGVDYDGWLLMECSGRAPRDMVAEMARQKTLLEKMVREARKA